MQNFADTGASFKEIWYIQTPISRHIQTPISPIHFDSPKRDKDKHAEVAVTPEGAFLFQANTKIIVGKC